MTRKTIKFALEIMAGLIAGIIILGVFGIWRLSSGPISLDYLTTTIEDTLNTEQDFVEIQIEDTVLTWGGWSRAIDIVARDVFVHQKDGQTLAHFPEVSIGLSLRALTRGIVAPTSLELSAPELNITRYEDGHFGFGLSTLDNQVEIDSADELLSLYKTFLDKPGDGGLLGYLARISIEDAKITYSDRQENSVWFSPDSSLIFERTKDQLTGNLKTTLTSADEIVDFSIGAIHEYGDDRMYLLANLDGLPPQMLLQVVPELDGFVGGEKQISGNLELALDDAARIRGADFLIFSEYGEVTGNLNLDETGVNATVELQLSDFNFSGLADGAQELAPLKALEAKVNATLKASGKTSGEIDEMILDVAIVDGKINLPDLYTEKLNIKSANFTITANDNLNKLDITEGLIDVGEGLISVSGQTHKNGDARDIKLSANLTDFKMQNLHKYWPQSLGSDAWDWVVPNIPKGNISEANIDITGTLKLGDPTPFELVDMGGKIVGSEIEVNYLSPMPSATDGVAVAEFGPGWFNVDIENGQVGNVNLDRGHIEITNIGVTDDFTADLDLAGPVDELLLHIDQEPLVFLDDLGFEREGATGQAKVNVNLALPLILDLTKDEVTVRVEADLVDLYLPDAFEGQAARAEKLNLVVDNKGLDVTGQVTLVDSLLDLKWHENFDTKENVKSQFNISGLVDKSALTDIGFDPGDYANGEFQVQLMLDEMRDGTKLIDAVIGLEQVHINVPPLNWEKETSIPGTLMLKAKILKDLKVLIAPLSLVADGLIFDGAMTLEDGGGKFSNLDAYRLEMGENSLSGSVVLNEEGRYIARASGPRFDVAGLTGSNEEKDDNAEPSIDDTQKDDGLAFDIVADFDILTDGPDSRLNDVTFDLVYENSIVQVLNLNSLAGTTPFSIHYTPARFGGHELVIRSNDAGAVMDQLDVSGRISGGEMLITGRRARAGAPIFGVASVSDFTILEAPSIAKILEFMSLTGIASALGGTGLPFTSLEADFSYLDGVVDIKRGLAFGDSIGITTTGQIDVDNNEYALKGTVAPIYSLSRAVSWIPVLGTLLSGDEGIFAARYSIGGAMDDPDVSVNPISALTPGVLRNIFNVFGDEEILSRDQNGITETPPETKPKFPQGKLEN